jgi:glutamate--cysteine ligase
MSALLAPSRAVRDAVGRLFTGVPSMGVPTIGIELELIPYRIAGHGVVRVEELRAALRDIPSISFEPGGQLELNPPPQPTVIAACAQLERLAELVDARLQAIGVTTAATGLNPWHTVDELGLQLRTDRYVVMDAYFQRIGPAGRTFMRQTASTQICIDLATGADGQCQWQAANLVVPVVAAMFANSPTCEGRNGMRTAICRAVDPARTRYGHPPLTVNEYVDFVCGANPLDDSYTGDEAIERHLSTLFPPVRPRGRYLEFRALDALPLGEVRTATELLACLLADRASTRAATRACSTVSPTTLWDHAEVGCHAPIMRDLALELIDIATAATQRLPTRYLPPGARVSLEALARRVATGQSLAPVNCPTLADRQPTPIT